MSRLEDIQMSSLVRGNGEKRKEGSGIRKNCSCHLCPIESCKEGYCKAETQIHWVLLTWPSWVLNRCWYNVSPTFSVLPSASELLTRS